VSMTMGRPAAAYPDQDHMAHIKIHLEYANNPAYGGNPVIGPAFTPHALEHIKQHLTLHYLQSMRAYVAEAAGGKDTFNLNQEKPLDLEAQQALAIASSMVSEDANITMQTYLPQINALAQKVQQMQQAQQQQAANADPTAQVILQTQMAETKRKSEEAQSRMQLDMQKDQQTYQLEVAKLQQQMADLQAKYQTQSTIDSQRNATQIAMADLNNSSKERIAEITARAELTSDQLLMQHEQDQTALMASHEAQADIRQHGIEIDQQNFLHQAQMAQQAAQQAAQADQARKQRMSEMLQARLQSQAQQNQPQQPSEE